MAWLRRNKSKAKKQHRNKGKNKRLDNELRAAGINPDLAFCTECGEWYNVRNSAALDRHAH
jgi:hypothetical protein